MGKTNTFTGKEQIENANPGGSSIEAFFADSVVLITGATGFLGKALVEKLLRSFPRLATIFILIRPKKGQTVEQRFMELIDNPVSHILNYLQERRYCFKKLPKMLKIVKKIEILKKY